uniref:SprT-like domain-containing protein n=1 Tax=Peronospora matthiolae TaxID=2874970 RepID=A0AAV1VDF8_9STRA
MYTQPCELLAAENEYIDPTPDLHSLFLEYNRMFFEGRLSGCEVKWSKRMTLCAGLCTFQPRSGFCSIRLSEPLLKLRPRSDLVNTLLHEMIHAYVFVATPVRDHDDHGPLFQGHMNRINKAAQTKITVFHTFHDEVDSYRQHVWQCNGSCRRTPPYFGLVKRSMNRAPGPTDRWWADHKQRCGGSYSKIKEPAEFTAKQAKKKEREAIREEKQKQKDRKAKAAVSVKEFFPLIKQNTDDDNLTGTARSDARLPLVGKKATRQHDTDVQNKKKRREKFVGVGEIMAQPTPEISTFASVVFAADGDHDGYFLVGDIRALIPTFPAQPPNRVNREDNRREASEKVGGDGSICATSTSAQVAGPSATVDLTVLDSDTSDDEQVEIAALTKLSRGTADSRPAASTRNVDVIELE